MLAAGLCDGCGLHGFQNGVVKFLHRRRHIAADDPGDLFPGARDLGVAVSGQILQLIDKAVAGAAGQVPDLDLAGAVGKVRFLELHGEDFRIVDGRAVHLVLIRLCGGGSLQGVGQAVPVHLDNLGFEVDPLVFIAEVVVGCRHGVHFKGVEDRHHRHALRNCGTHSDLGIRPLNDPLVENSVGNKGCLGQGGDYGIITVKVLHQHFVIRHAAVFGADDKGHRDLIRKRGVQRQVRADALSAGEGFSVRSPAGEGFARQNGVGRQGQRIPTVIGGLVIEFTLHQETDVEDLLVINGPDRHVALGGDGVVKQPPAVLPVSGITLLPGNLRDIVEAVAGVNVHGACCHFLGGGEVRTGVELQRIGYFVIIRDNGQVRGGDKALVDARHGRPHGTLAAFGRGADCPVGIIVFPVNRLGKRADGLAFFHAQGRQLLVIPVQEGQRPVFRLRFIFVFIFRFGFGLFLWLRFLFRRGLRFGFRLRFSFGLGSHLRLCAGFRHSFGIHNRRIGIGLRLRLCFRLGFLLRLCTGLRIGFRVRFRGHCSGIGSGGSILFLLRFRHGLRF